MECGEGPEIFAKNVLDKGVARLYSEVGQGGANVTSFAKPPRRGGADI
jgi:hypothetical protein